MDRNVSLRDRRGSALVFVLFVVLVIAIVGVAALWIAHSRNDKKAQQANQTTTIEEDAATKDATGKNPLELASDNVERKNDASRVASAVDEYQNNNSGNLPTSATTDLRLSGGEMPGDPVLLKHYKTFTVATGDYPAITSDQLVLVTRAACGPNGTAVAADSNRAYVLVYSVERDDNTFASACAER